MFGWLKRGGRVGGKDPKQWDHYKATQKVGGAPHQLTLSEVSVEGPIVVLVYRWEDEDLSYQEADRLDTRARAFVSCAIRDAAIAAKLSCEPGPPHGQRPSWKIAGQGVPVSLMSAGFDVAERVCWMRVGPSIGIGGRPSGSESVAADLAKGFESHFERITV